MDRYFSRSFIGQHLCSEDKALKTASKNLSTNGFYPFRSLSLVCLLSQGLLEPLITLPSQQLEGYF